MVTACDVRQTLRPPNVEVVMFLKAIVLLTYYGNSPSSPSYPIHTDYVEAYWHNAATNLLLLLL